MTSDKTATRHVFVDPTGRRAGLLRLLAWTVTALLTCGLALLVVALVAPPSLTRVLVPGLTLPGAAAPPLAPEGDAATGDPRAVLEATTAAPARPTASRTTAPAAGPGGSAPPAPGPEPTPAPTSRVSPTPAPLPSPRPSPTQRSGRPTTPPGQASATPGQGNRPTDKPTPRRPTATGKP